MNKKKENKEYNTDNMTRLTPIMIYKLLKDESSEQMPLTTGYILSRLEEQGLKITRQTMYKDIVLLRQMGFEILCTRSRSNEYYLVQDDLNEAELRILLDAVQAARFIPPKKTSDLLYKVAALNGQAQAQDLIKGVMKGGVVKYQDENIFYSISNIATAITENRKITFYYFDYNEKRKKKYRRNKEPYTENPLGTVCSSNNYYLLVYNEKHKNIINYRIDHMEGVEIADEERNLPEDVDKRTEEYLDSQFGMYAGKREMVRFEADSSLVNSILDMFGDEAEFSPSLSGFVRFRAPVQISPVFFGWVAGFGGKMKITYPSTVASDYCNFLKESLKQYPERTSGIAWEPEGIATVRPVVEQSYSLASKASPRRPSRLSREAYDSDEEYEAARAERREQLRRRRAELEAQDGIPRRGPGRPRKIQAPESQDTAVSAQPAEPPAPAKPDEDTTV